MQIFHFKKASVLDITDHNLDLQINITTVALKKSWSQKIMKIVEDYECTQPLTWHKWQYNGGNFYET